MKAARIFLGLLVLCGAALGLLLIFEIVDSEKALKYGASAAGGLALLAVASVVLGAMGTKSKETEPPPQL